MRAVERVAFVFGCVLVTEFALGFAMSLLPRSPTTFTFTTPEGFEAHVSATVCGSSTPWAWGTVILLGIAAFWCAFGGILALKALRLDEARKWRGAVAIFGLLGVLVGIAGAGYEYREGARELDQLGEKATPMDLAYFMDNAAGCLLLGAAAGAAGGIGLGALSLARRRARRRLAEARLETSTPPV